MTHHKLLIIALHLTLGLAAFATLSACSGKFPSTTTVVNKAPSTPLSQMSEDFLYLSAQNAIHHGQQELAVQFLTALVKKNPDARAPRMQLAEMLLRSNRVDQAIVHIDAVLGKRKASSATTSEEAYPYILRARALVLSKKVDEAQVILSTLLANQPGLLDARLFHISLLIGMKKLSDAHFSIIAGLRDHETVELRKIQADLLMRQNRLDEAIQALEAMQKLDRNNESPVLLLSQIALKQKKKARAESLLRDYIEEHPDAIHVRNALGRMLVQSGRPLEAVSIYKGLVRDTGGTIDALSSLGLLYFQLKDYESAAKQFRKALKNSPNDQSRFYLAASLEATKQPEKAKKLYLEIEKTSVVYVDAQLRLAGLELANDHINAAEKRIKSIIANFSDTADAYLLLSSIYLNQEKYQQLLDETEFALGLPEVPSRLFFNRAVAYEHFKRHDDVESSLTQLLSIDPKNPEALNFLGYVYAERGIKLIKAETLILRALEQKPNDGYYLDSLAWVYFQRGEYAKAIKTQTEAIKKIKDDPVMFEHMGDMFWKSKKPEKARNNWKKALQFKHAKPEKIRKKITEGLKAE